MSKLVLLGPVFNLLKSVTDMRKIGAISSLIHNLQRYHFSSPLLGVEKKRNKFLYSQSHPMLPSYTVPSPIIPLVNCRI